MNRESVEGECKIFLQPKSSDSNKIYLVRIFFEKLVLFNLDLLDGYFFYGNFAKTYRVLIMSAKSIKGAIFSLELRWFRWANQ